MSTEHGGTQTAPAASQGVGAWIVLGLVAVTMVALATAGVLKRAAQENREASIAGDATTTDAGVAARLAELRILAKISPNQALPELEPLLETGSIPEQQAGFAMLGAMDDPRADAILSHWLDVLASDRLPAECRLDLTEAAAKHLANPEIKAKLASYESKRPQDDPLAAYQDTLIGGNADRGHQIFLEKAEAQCVRCHRLDGNGGEVGPELTGIGSRHPREYFLESIILPNKEIAKGYEGIVIALADGTILSGVMRGEDDKGVKVMTAEGKLVEVPTDDIDARKSGASAMPEDFSKQLTKFEIRDLVEMLSESKETKGTTGSKETKETTAKAGSA